MVKLVNQLIENGGQGLPGIRFDENLLVRLAKNVDGSIYLLIYHKHQPNVGKYSSPMDPMGTNNFNSFDPTTSKPRAMDKGKLHEGPEGKRDSRFWQRRFVGETSHVLRSKLSW